jgi:hypothetical protein
LFRTLRSRYRRIVPALIGSVAILAAVFLAQSATGPKGSAAPQLAAAERSADGTASRGANRTADGGLALQIAEAAQFGEFGSPQDAADATTTTTTAPTTTTTTAAPTTTTAKPATTTTAKPKPTAVPVTQSRSATTVAQSKPSGGSICAISPGAWCSVAKCESGDRNVNTGNGYYGYFQFSAGTWHAMGGTGLPSDNSAEKQLELAQKLKARSGAGQWPVCGKYL